MPGVFSWKEYHVATVKLSGKLADITAAPVENTTRVTVKSPIVAPGTGTIVTTKPQPVQVARDGSVTITVEEGLGWLYLDGDGWSDSIRFVAKTGMKTLLEAVMNSGVWPIPGPLAEQAIESINQARDRALSVVNNTGEATPFIGYSANAGKRLSLDTDGKIKIVTAQVTAETDAASKGYVDGRITPQVMYSRDLNDMDKPEDAGWFYVTGAAAARTMQNWPVETAGYLLNRVEGIRTQIVTIYDAEAPQVWIRNFMPGPQEWSEWVQLGVGGGSTSNEAGISSGEAALRHALMEDDTRKRAGYRVPTNGLPVVMLRFDDYAQDFKNKVLPLLRKYNLPAYWACTKRHVEDEQPTPWSEVQSWCLDDGIRIWNHSMSHSNAATLPGVIEETQAADYFESKMPQVVVDGWVMPGTGANPPYIDYKDNRTENYYATAAGRLLMARHGVVNGGKIGYMQPMGGAPVGQSHFTFEKSSVAEFKAQVNAAKQGPYALGMMAHPKFIGTSGYMSAADFEACMAWLASERDAGRIMVLTGNVAPALDAGFGQRNDLMPVGATSLPFTRQVDVRPVGWARGGTREVAVTVSASASATVRVEVTVPGLVSKQVDHTVQAGESTVRTFFTIPAGANAVTVGVSRLSGGTVRCLESHMWAA